MSDIVPLLLAGYRGDYESLSAEYREREERVAKHCADARAKANRVVGPRLAEAGSRTCDCGRPKRWYAIVCFRCKVKR